jgi:hypothetical protein
VGQGGGTGGEVEDALAHVVVLQVGREA